MAKDILPTNDRSSFASLIQQRRYGMNPVSLFKIPAAQVSKRLGSLQLQKMKMTKMTKKTLTTTRVIKPMKLKALSMVTLLSISAVALSGCQYLTTFPTSSVFSSTSLSAGEEERSIEKVEGMKGVDSQDDLDRVHVRDDSALFQKASRGGAALRQKEATHVLFNRHHEGENNDVGKGDARSVFGPVTVPVSFPSSVMEGESAPLVEKNGQDSPGLMEKEGMKKEKEKVRKKKDTSIYAKDSEKKTSPAP